MIMSKEEAYKDYLDKYRDEIDNMIHKANEKHETHIQISIETPKEIIDELRKYGYELVEKPPIEFKIKKETYSTPKYYTMSWEWNKTS